MNTREYPARVVRVVDGDTVRLGVDLGFRMTYRDSFRLAGINAPEGRKTGAMAMLESMLHQGREVVVTTSKPEKFGCWLADIAIPEVCTSICELLLREGLAVPYDGGKR